MALKLALCGQQRKRSKQGDAGAVVQEKRKEGPAGDGVVAVPHVPAQLIRRQGPSVYSVASVEPPPDMRAAATQPSQTGTEAVAVTLVDDSDSLSMVLPPVCDVDVDIFEAMKFLEES